MSLRVLAGLVLLACSFAAAQQPPAQQPPAPALPIAEASAPLPDIQTLMPRVRSRYLSLENLRKHYICTVTEVADEFSSNGSKKTHTDQYQAFYVNNTEVLQHISRDGKPLSPEDAKKEQERVDKTVARLKSQPNKPEKDEVNLSVSALLKVATFTNPRRELINGRPTLVFDYKGNPGAKAGNLGEQIMRELAGTLWIDEKDEAVLRLSGSLQQNFHIAGGMLVNIKKGSWIDFRFEPVNSEIWFPAEFNAHIDGRVLLLKGFNANGRDTFTDYRKLKTSVTILPGTQVLVQDNVPAPTAPQPDATTLPATGSAPRP